MTHENPPGYATHPGVGVAAIPRQPHNNGNLIRPPSSSANAVRERTDLDGLFEFQTNLSDRMRHIVVRLHDLRQKISPVPSPDAKASQESPTPSGVLHIMLARFEDQAQLISTMESICLDLEKAL